jgi:hypothetical protein
MSTSDFSIMVPGSGFGPAVDVSSLVGEKTVVLSGRFRGAYVLYGSHDGVRFAPLLIFNAGGIESIRQTFKVSLAQVRLKSLATGADGVSATVSGLSVPGDNSFASLAMGGVLDLGTDLYQVDLNFMGFGVVSGKVVVEGSNDGVGFNPIGEFASSLAGASLLGGGSGIEFSPVVTTDRIRYVRLSVQGSAPGFVVTVGGAVNGGGGGAGTLAATYDAGSSQLDQTMTLDAVKGGKIVVDASGARFSDPEALLIVVPGGTGAGFLLAGGMELGPDFINIQEAGWPDNIVGQDGIAIGGLAVVGDTSVAIGIRASAPGRSAIAIGATAEVTNDAGIAIGEEARSDGGIALGVFSHGGAWDVAIGNATETGTGMFNVVVGQSLVVAGVGDSNVLFGYSMGVGDGTPSETRDFFQNVKIGDGGASFSTRSATIGSNHEIGATTDVDIVDSCLAIGYNCIIGGTVGGVPINNGIAIGKGAFIVNIVDAEGNGGNANDAIAIGTGANANEEGSIAIGNGALISFIQAEGADATGDIAIGNGAMVDSYYGGVVAIGQGATALGGDVNYSVVIGTSASVGSSGCVAIGWYANCASGGVSVGSFTKTGQEGVSVGDSCDTSAASTGIAIGVRSKVTGACGMAFGRVALAGAHEVVFGSSDNGLSEVSKFRAVSGLASNADLFTFDQLLVGSPGTTSMRLLIQNTTGGGIVSVPVTLSVPVGGVSNLQVANS